MNEWKPALRLVVMVQIFLLFMAIIMPAVVRSLHQLEGKWAYGFLTVLCVAQALLLRRLLTQLE